MGNLSNQANSVVNGVYSVSQGSGAGINDLTNVGAFTNSASAYGTYDQGGGVFEWNDAVIGSSSAGMRGGSWNDATFHLLSDARDSSGSDTEYGTIGFRVATIPENVPEPGTAISLFLAVGLLLARRGRTV